MSGSSPLTLGQALGELQRVVGAFPPREAIPVAVEPNLRLLASHVEVLASAAANAGVSPEAAPPPAQSTNGTASTTGTNAPAPSVIQQNVMDTLHRRANDLQREVSGLKESLQRVTSERERIRGELTALQAKVERSAPAAPAIPPQDAELEKRRLQALDDRERAIAAREATLPARERELDRREAGVVQRTADVTEIEDGLIAREEQVEERERRLERLVRELQRAVVAADPATLERMSTLLKELQGATPTPSASE